MKVAVLLSSYNGEEYIQTQIDSILAQHGPMDVDLWVRDDGSTDSTHQILQRYAEEGKLHWYTGENLRSARSFMNLLKHCEGYDYYAFADQDDYWMPEKVYSGVRALSEQTGPALYFANAELVDRQLSGLGRNVYRKSPKLDFETLSCAGSILGCAIVLNSHLAKIVQEKDMPEQIPMHDFYVSLLCLAFDGMIIYDPVAYIKYRQHGHNVVGVPNGLIGTIKSRLADICTRETVSIAQMAETVLRLYGEQLSDDKKKWLSKIENYRKSFINRVMLACSLKTRYVNWNMALKLRLSILFGNR